VAWIVSGRVEDMTPRAHGTSFRMEWWWSGLTLTTPGSAWQQFETPKYMVMVFELMEGGDLYRYLSSLPKSCMSEVSTTAAVLSTLPH
jgi:hypothetical protein